ncbi:MAG: hypothetical protein HQ559_16205, partial [Lentisphaerae bacterium]|nr:hypothetical protein [Lentisphaerota bacterium]
LGCSARLYEFTGCLKPVEDPRVSHTWTDTEEGKRVHVIDTPVGKQTEITYKSENNWHPLHEKREVVTEDELKVAAWREEHMNWEWDEALYDTLLSELGDLGPPAIILPRMNIQDLYIERMGTEKGIYALYDWPDTVNRFFTAREESHGRMIDLLCDQPVEIMNFGENVHASTLPPELYLKHQLPAGQRRCEKLHAAGKFVYSHWDGDCGPLLPYVHETGLDGIEAITPLPQGDVTLEQAREALGDEMFLLDGLPAVYFDETYPVSVLEECTHRLIELFAPKLVVGISDEISSTGDIERIRVVGNIVDEYNAGIESAP